MPGWKLLIIKELKRLDGCVVLLAGDRIDPRRDIHGNPEPYGLMFATDDGRIEEGLMTLRQEYQRLRKAIEGAEDFDYGDSCRCVIPIAGALADGTCESHPIHKALSGKEQDYLYGYMKGGVGFGLYPKGRTEAGRKEAIKRLDVLARRHGWLKKRAPQKKAAPGLRRITTKGK